MGSRSHDRLKVTASLRQLAREYGVQTAYNDFFKRRTDASDGAVLETVRLLGARVQRPADVPDAIRARTEERWKQVLEPVVVVRPRQSSSAEVRLPAARAGGRLSCRLRLEDGTERRWICDLRRTATIQTKDVEGSRYVSKRVTLPRSLPPGYHQLTIEGVGDVRPCRVIAAPMRAFSAEGRHWGAFLPLYALHSGDTLGAGDFSDLERLRDWIGQLGGSLVSTLPLMAAHAESPFDPSPYAPSSRLFWNELYVDPRRTPELAACPRAQRLMASPPFQREIASLRAAPQVDYERQRVLRRAVLGELARSLGRSENGRHRALRRYVAAHPSLEDYAAFAATLERRQDPWPDWPEPLGLGVIDPADYDPEVRFYHLYVQWLAEQQLAAASSKTGGKPGLYLDLPLGVHTHGYDAWRYRDLFALDASGGAPPDSVFSSGQNWGFPPLHPERIRAEGYRYLIGCLQRQMTHASFLRIDHVMALHRLYWIPKGWPAGDGVYVEYRPEELYAILSLESHRHQVTIVGENLGTVPASVNAALSRHGIRKMYVLQYEAQPSSLRPVRRVPADSVASLNTHDMPPFTAYLRGMDLEDRSALGLLAQGELRSEGRTRSRIRRALVRFLRRQGWLLPKADQEPALTKTLLAWLAASAASLVLVNLEDLWQETVPQNLPGTGTERPNWRHKARYSLNQLATLPSVVEALRLVADTRARERTRR